MKNLIELKLTFMGWRSDADFLKKMKLLFLTIVLIETEGQKLQKKQMMGNFS